MTNRPIDDDGGLIADLPDLRIEVSHSEEMVILQQSGSGGDVDRIAIHRWQVRMLAEQFGHQDIVASIGPRRSRSPKPRR